MAQINLKHTTITLKDITIIVVLIEELQKIIKTHPSGTVKKITRTLQFSPDFYTITCYKIGATEIFINTFKDISGCIIKHNEYLGLTDFLHNN